MIYYGQLSLTLSGYSTVEMIGDIRSGDFKSGDDQDIKQSDHTPPPPKRVVDSDILSLHAICYSLPISIFDSLGMA